MLILRGAPALSNFRLNKLMARLSPIVAGEARLSAAFVHFVDADGELSADETGVLERLLDYGPAHGEADQAGALFLVVPRPGTLSPWSSKATDIAHNCGLSRIARIERGIAYRISGGDPHAEARQAIAARLHDRMTQIVLRCAGGRAGAVPACPADPVQQRRRAVRWSRCPGRCQPRSWSGIVGRRGRLPGREFFRTGAQSQRCRTDDVCPGQLRTLSTQDLQCRLDDRRRGAGSLAVCHDPQHHQERAGRRAVGLQGQCRGDQRLRGLPVLPGCGVTCLRPARRTHPHPDEGRDAQSPDGDLARSGRRNRGGWRDPRRGRHRHRLQAEGRLVRFLGIQSADSRRRATLGGGFRQAGSYRQRARHHARRADRRRRVQQ